MRELLPVVSDDLDWHEKETRTPATAVVSVGYMGEWFNLDLTDEHCTELDRLIRRYVMAGAKTGQPYKRKAASAAQRDRGRTFPELAATRRRWADFRDWCEQRGIELVHYPSGKFVYPPDLVAEFDRERAASGGEGG